MSAKGTGRRRSFAVYALTSLATFLMAARVVLWLDGPVWLGGTFVVLGVMLGLYYLYRHLAPRRPRRRR